MYGKRNKSKFKILIFVVIFVCLAMASLFINKNFNLPNFFLKDAVLYVDRFVGGAFKTPDDYDSVIKENEELKRELEKAKNYEIENTELVSEISKLKSSLKLNKLLSDKELINASVYSRSLDYWNEKLIIDKGSNDGISNNMAVVSNGGLIGITDDVSRSNSSILLLSNSKFPINISVKVKIDDKEVYGILNNYNDGMYEVVGVVENIDIAEGSMVVTTGLGNIFPSGVLVGYVSSITTDNFDLSKVVNVKPAVDFNNISYVTVVKRDDK